MQLSGHAYTENLFVGYLKFTFNELPSPVSDNLLAGEVGWCLVGSPSSGLCSFRSEVLGERSPARGGDRQSSEPYCWGLGSSESVAQWLCL